jgi:hypothetical protein
MRRISVAGLMAVVVFCGVGLAALRNASDLWAGILLQLTLLTFGISTIAVVCRHGRERARWFSFSLFGVGYMLIAFTTWGAKIEPVLVTTQLFRWVNGATQSIGAPDRLFLPMLEENYARLSAYLKDPRQRMPGDSPNARLEAEAASLRDDLIELDSKLTRGFELSSARRATRRLQQLLPGARHANAFKQVGHCLSAILAGVVGGIISARLYREPPAERQGFAVH